MNRAIVRPRTLVSPRHCSKAAAPQMTVGALYGTLYRLEAKELLHSWCADPTAERGGRSKRYFKLLPAGGKAPAGSKAMFDRMWEGLRV